MINYLLFLRRASKYVIWLGVKICHLVGHRNMSFGKVCMTTLSDHQTMLFCAWNGEDKFEKLWE